MRFPSGSNKVAIEFQVVQFWSEIIYVRTCAFKLNSYCALFQFWNHVYDFRPNCTPPNSITNIKSLPIKIRCPKTVTVMIPFRCLNLMNYDWVWELQLITALRFCSVLLSLCESGTIFGGFRVATNSWNGYHMCTQFNYIAHVKCTCPRKTVCEFQLFIWDVMCTERVLNINQICNRLWLIHYSPLSEMCWVVSCQKLIFLLFQITYTVVIHVSCVSISEYEVFRTVWSHHN